MTSKFIQNWSCPKQSVDQCLTNPLQRCPVQQCPGDCNTQAKQCLSRGCSWPSRSGALPAGGGAWVAPFQRFLEARAAPVLPAHDLAAYDRRHEVSECECNATAGANLPVGEAASLVALGFGLWPLLDILYLAKRAWQRRVQAAERALQAPLLLRPPDRP